jgi:aspartyl-tRNA(Asn)/glutamyl-tRNA(Gln) amidotransferase subunit A
VSQEELCYLSAIELRELYRRRALSPVEVVDAVLERIERYNPVLAAYVTVTGELARKQALDAELGYFTGRDHPALLGVPVSIKDVTPTRGIRTTRGSLLWKDWLPEEDAPVVERLYQAGAVLLGKTNTPELGWKGDSGNRLIGPTQNPWQIGRTAGGSSGGAAAAVAAGLGPLAQGTDGAGSIRIPAAFCGIFGFKPSFGLVPYYPPSTVETLAHVGPMTRTVTDAALMLNVLAGPDPRDRNSLNVAGVDFLATLNGSVAGLRAGWVARVGDLPVDPEVERMTEEAGRLFLDLGCEVEALAEPLEDPYPVLDLIWSTAMAAVHRSTLDEVRDLVDPGRLAVIEAGRAVSGVDLAWAHAERAAYAERLRRATERYDFLLSPTVPVPAFTAGADHPGQVGGRRTTYLSWTPFTYPFNFTGQPAATVPCGFTRDGLPVGLQIVGRWRDDVTVLRLAAIFERHRPWAQHRPPLDSHIERPVASE